MYQFFGAIAIKSPVTRPGFRSKLGDGDIFPESLVIEVQYKSLSYSVLPLPLCQFRKPRENFYPVTIGNRWLNIAVDWQRQHISIKFKSKNS
jgi:hypothetical protein